MISRLSSTLTKASQRSSSSISTLSQQIHIRSAASPLVSRIPDSRTHTPLAAFAKSLPVQYDIQTRTMAIRAKMKNRTNTKKEKKGQNTPLINEKLIRVLLKKTKTTAESIQVRLLVDQGRDEKPLVEMLTLHEAISVSTEEGVDLVGINIDQKMPVLKCIDVNKFLYQQNKKGKKSGASGNKSTKQFTFKAGIDDNDLQRKAKNMVGYLTKGHACQVTITSNRRNLNADKDIITVTLGRLVEIVGDAGTQQGKMKTNEYGNRASMLFQPNSKKN